MMINTSTSSKILIIFLVYYFKIVSTKNALLRNDEIVSSGRIIEIEELLINTFNFKTECNQIDIDLKAIKTKETTNSRERLICSLQSGIKNELSTHRYRPLKINSILGNIKLFLSEKYSEMSDQKTEFKFNSYAPFIFNSLRTMFGIDKSEYISSLCDNDFISMSNPGASISQFYFTNDKKYVIKTTQVGEDSCLLKLIAEYQTHFQNNPKSLLPKFSGYFGIKQNLLTDFNVVIMNNLLPFQINMYEKFDLKGSTLNRKASLAEKNKKSPTFKDLDFMEKYPFGIKLSEDIFSNLINILSNDCKLLESLKIMDYSFLMGIYKIDQLLEENQNLHEAAARKWMNSKVSKNKDDEDYDNEYDVLFKDCIPATNKENEKLLLFVGIIDVLQVYNMRKTLELKAKTFSLRVSSSIENSEAISVQKPDVYRERFIEFMRKTVFTTDYSLPSRNIDISE